MGNRTQNILNSVDTLVNEDLGQLLFLLMTSATAMGSAIGHAASLRIRSGTSDGLNLKTIGIID